MRTGIAGVAREMVIMPVEQELSIYDRFRAELAIARGRLAPGGTGRSAGLLTPAGGPD